jgi:CTP-dependent riboflavin kinase
MEGLRHFTRRMTEFPQVFTAATGEKLFPGTLNVRVGMKIPPVEHFRIHGRDLGEPEQDLLFEVCRVNDIWAYRIRPWNLLTHEGGHGDDVIEIAASVQLRPLLTGKDITISFFR